MFSIITEIFLGNPVFGDIEMQMVVNETLIHLLAMIQNYKIFTQGDYGM